MSDTTSGGFLSGMFSDPTTMGLLGAAQAMSQAAMPSRMPVPFGAAIGAAAGGLAQGGMAAQRYQMAAQQAKAAQLNNQLLEASMPFRVGLLQGLQGQAGGGGGGQSGGGGDAGASAGGAQAAPGASPGFAGGGGGGASPYLVSPDLMRQMAMYAMASGQDRAASSIFNNMQAMAGGNGYSWGTNGTAFATPGGGQDPRVLYNRQFATTQGALPAKAAEIGMETGAQHERAINSANVGLQRDYATPSNVDGVYATPSQRLGQGAPQIGGNGAPIPQDPFPQITSRIMQMENGTGNPAAQNPNSSARGNGQFIDSTWPTVIRAVRPDLAAGRTDQQLLALRDDPNLSAAATDAYARQNAAKMAQSGFQVTPENVYLAHRFGPGGAMSLLRVNPDTPGSMVLGDGVMKANPDLQGKTAGQIVGMAQAAMAPQPRQVAPGIQQVPLPNGGVVTTNTRPQQDEQYKLDIAHADEATNDIEHAQQQQVRLLHMRDLASSLPTGAGGETRGAIANYIQTYMPSLANTWATRQAQIPDAKLSQEFAKMALTSAGEQEKGVLGGRGGFRAIELYKQANPSLELQPTANRDIINMQLIAQQADVDYARGLQGWVSENGQNYIAGKANYQPSLGFDRQWTQQRNPQVYAAAIDALNGAPFEKWSKGLTKDEGLRTLQIIQRADPNAAVVGENGKPWPVARFAPQASAQ